METKTLIQPLLPADEEALNLWWRQIKEAEQNLLRKEDAVHISRVKQEEECQKLRQSILSCKLQIENQRLWDLADSGASGLRVVSERTRLVDILVRLLCRLTVEDYYHDTGRIGGCVVLALGGYGRQELCLNSDVDLMFLHYGTVDFFVDSLVKKILHTLWDIGFEVGHSCRSLEECQRVAGKDLTSLTSMMDSRYLAGDTKLYEDFCNLFLDKYFRSRAAGFVKTKLAERETRYQFFGPTFALAEPNVKESPGGLRDLHLALWVATAKAGCKSLADLKTEKLIDEKTYNQVTAAWDFILSVRNLLHLHTRQKTDLLTHHLKPALATALGFVHNGLPDKEALMKHYFQQAYTMHQFSRELIDRLTRKPRRTSALLGRWRKKDLGANLYLEGGEIHLQQQDAWGSDPAEWMELFEQALYHKALLDPEVKTALQERLARRGDGLPYSPRAGEHFFNILKEKAGAAGILRQMNELGVLERFLPEFGAIKYLSQDTSYHHYTVDEHTLQALEAVEALPNTKEPLLKPLAQLWKGVDNLHHFRLAILLHDVGKSRGDNHVQSIVQMLPQTLERLGVTGVDAEKVKFLVEHHLTMAEVAQHRDLDDPKTVINFAQIVKSEEFLSLLYLMTYADIRAVGPDSWNDWKATLLWELFIKTNTVLTKGAAELVMDEIKKARVVSELTRQLPREIDPAVIRQHFAGVSEKYLSSTPISQISAHLRLVENIKDKTFTMDVIHNLPIGYSQLTLCTLSRVGNFARIAGIMTANNLNILSAQLYTRQDNIAFDIFQVCDSKGRAIPDNDLWQDIGRQLGQVFTGQIQLEELLSSRWLTTAFKGARRPLAETVILFHNDLSEDYTVMEVKTQDRRGLLYLLSSTLAQFGFNIGSAKITTQVDQALDVFYFTDREGKKVGEEEVLADLRQKLLTALEK
jgi:[protein-PII] uridylyltransferase